MRKVLRDRLRQLAEAGFAVDDVHINKHVKVHVTDPRGRPHLIVLAQSPSDRRVQANFTSQLRRLARQGTASTGDLKCAHLTP
jgi:hypothetical protein